MIPLAAALIPIVGELAKQGLSLLGNAVLVKGKDFIEKETGVKLGAEMSPADLLTLKQYELEHETSLLRLKQEDNRIELEYYQAELADRQSARAREIEVTRINNAAGMPWFIPSVTTFLAVVVVLGGGFSIIQSGLDTDVKFAINTMMSLVLGYYFGTTKGSAAKDTTISNLSAKEPKE